MTLYLYALLKNKIAHKRFTIILFVIECAFLLW